MTTSMTKLLDSMEETIKLQNRAKAEQRARKAQKQEEDFRDGQGMSEELSKEAKKELFLKNQDKGYEH